VVEYTPVPQEPERIVGRVLGKLMEQGTKLPIAQATLKSVRIPSPIETDERGLFVVGNLDPGAIEFEITHPDYEPGACHTQIPERAGDVPLHCFLEPKPSAGAISGQVKDERGRGIEGANIEISGPNNAMVVTRKDGLFALPDAPEGSYRLRVDADGYLLQLVQVDVASRETALPQIILVEKPRSTLVTLKQKEIVIKQQVNFATGSADIDVSSTALLTEVADVLMRSPHVQLVEIQGHTDNKGGRDFNQALSQSRAEAVLAWLVRAGVESTRLQARGYGQDQPLRANDTAANRAVNRRVQLIILRQAP
jgi:OmpA-OmpF porin, OOP family